MSQKLNNFPREGQHNTITRDSLDKLEASRPKHNTELNYTIGGPTETYVHACVEADRNYALNAGHQRFSELSDKIQSDHVFTANKGRAKAEFQASNNTDKTYAQRQREAAQKARSREREHSR